MKFADYVREDRRLQILICLEACPGYRASHFLLRHALDAFGHESSTDTLKGDLAWLEEQGLIATRQVEDAVVVDLRERGLDVAQARVVHPGVKRPQPA